MKITLERVRGEWRTTAKDSRSWRLLIENVGREREERNDEENMTMNNHGQPHP